MEKKTIGTNEIKIKAESKNKMAYIVQLEGDAYSCSLNQTNYDCFDLVLWGEK